MTYLHDICVILHTAMQSIDTALTSLDLGDNQVGDEGARALALNTTLTSLDLGNNQVGDLLNVIKQRISQNRTDQSHRRNLFIRQILTLTGGVSCWSQLPGDLRRYILWHLCDSFPLSYIGKNPQQAYECALFLMTNVVSVKQQLKCGPLRIVEKAGKFM